MIKERFDSIYKDWVTMDVWHARRSEGNTVTPQGAVIAKPFKEFKSPIDGKIISDRRQLASHNKQHGVTNTADYSPEYFAAAKERMARETVGDTPQQDHDRRKALVHNLRRAGVKI